MIAPQAKIDDGILDYAVVKKCSRLTMFRLVPEFMNGTHMRFDNVKMGSCKSISVTADRPMYIHADGEVYTSFGSNLKGMKLEILPSVLQVVRG